MDDTSYEVIRFYKDSSHPDHHKIIKSDLTRQEVTEYFDENDTKEDDVWFDGFQKE